MRAVRLVAVVAALALWAAACAGANSGTETTATNPSSTTLAATASTAETTTSPPSSTAAPQTTIGPDESPIELTTAAEHPECTVPTGHGQQGGCIVNQGLVREYLLQVPSSYDTSAPTPLVMFFHGGSGNMKGVFRTGLFGEARERGWLAVSLQGADIGNVPGYSWNAVHCCGISYSRGVDDIGFVRALVTELEDALNVDSSRIYASGFSNGAMLVHRIGSEMSDVVAAIAPASGTIGGADPSSGPAVTIAPPPGPIPVMLMHGVQDTTVNFRGGVSKHADRFDISFVNSASFWANANGCDPTPTTADESWGTHATFGGCPEHGELIANAYDDLGHAFPTVAKDAGVDGAIQVMDFFARQQLP